tara:strand:+ start:3001 stop:4740 length:1740 start_codon:yes stop_codon:yes gene_type:complete
MPTINSSLVPTISPGNVFSKFTTDSTLNIRWLTATDPVFFESLNRPHADLVLRQLILAKAVDTLQLSLGKQVLYPFLVQPQVTSGISIADVPANWVWDISLSMPKKWEMPRLAKVKRISGTNVSGTYTGYLRLIFTASQETSTAELAVFYADYQIDSDLTYQLSRLQISSTIEEALSINTTETQTVAGFIEFRTMDTTKVLIQTFLNLMAPPTDTTSTDGFYNNPSVYAVVDSEAGGTEITGDFNPLVIGHGTGLLVDSAWNAIPNLDSDLNVWLETFNYPFDATAIRSSADNINIPKALFREFDIVAPAGDEPKGTTIGTYFPVWVSRIERVTNNQMKWYFSTHNVTEVESDGNPTQVGVEFATLVLDRASVSGDIVSIEPEDDLKLALGTSNEELQHFGRGHVVLSSLWDKATVTVDDFFDSLLNIVDNPADTSFSQAATRLSSFSISRVPKYTPTAGQSRALFGSTSRRTAPVLPSYENRFVTELDQGIGNQVDLESSSGVTSHVAIDRFGHAGSLCHKTIKLVVDSTKLPEDDTTFYDDHVLPRLRILLGRDPAFGDYWFNGTRLMFHTGDVWIG